MSETEQINAGAGLATGEENNLKGGETGSNDSPNKTDDGSFNFFSIVLGPGILFLYLVFLLFSDDPFQLYSIASYFYPY